MKNGKYSIKVFLTDDDVFVSCENGPLVSSPKSNAWLWVLGAIAFPEENRISIVDTRYNREEDQTPMSTGGFREFTIDKKEGA